jgi:predicted membrane channel-forming protein YqfA (hemolysin III family)
MSALRIIRSMFALYLFTMCGILGHVVITDAWSLDAAAKSSSIVTGGVLYIVFFGMAMYETKRAIDG